VAVWNHSGVTRPTAVRLTVTSPRLEDDANTKLLYHPYNTLLAAITLGK